METATMHLETAIVSANWTQSPAPASALPVLRRPSTPRRKARPRSPDFPEDRSAKIEDTLQPHPLSQLPSQTQSQHCPTVQEKPKLDPKSVDKQLGPASSTANLLTDDDLDIVTDIASDKDYPNSHIAIQKKDEQATPQKNVKPGQSPQAQSLTPALPNICPQQSLRPITCLDSDVSSDEEEDYRQNYRRFLRRRTQEDDTEELKVLEEVRKKRSRSARRGKREENNLKKKVALPATFHTTEAQRHIKVSLTAAEMDHDLTDMFGLEEDEADEAEDMKNGDIRGVKRKRSDELSSEDMVLGSKRRFPTPPKVPKQKGKIVVTRGKNTTVKKVTTSVVKSNMGKKKTSVNLVASGNISKMFVKHTVKKGWSVCVECGVEVWPPNCQKHLSACHGSA